MILSYIWIKNFKNIYECGYNFDNDLYISLDNEGNKYTLSVNRQGTINVLKQFTGNVENLTVVVGENGSGKSNLFDFIKKIYSDKNMQNKYIAVYRDDEELYIVSNNFQNELIEVDSLVHEFRINEGDTIQSIKHMLPSLVFYSDVYDYRAEITDKNCEEFTNISTNYLAVQKDYKFRHMEIKKQITFLMSEYADGELDKPDKIKLGISSLTQEKVVKKIRNALENQKRYSNKSSNEEFIYLTAFHLDQLYKLKYSSSLKDDLIKIYKKISSPKFYKSTMNGSNVNIVNSCGFITSYFFIQYYNLIKESSSTDFMFTIANELVNVETFEQLLVVLLHLAESRDESVRTRIVSVEKNMKLLNELVWKHKIIKDKQTYFVEVDFDDESIGSILELDMLASATDNEFVFDMMDYSSGEKALLNFYARMHNIKNKIEEGSICLIIDEAGLYYHPKWQREYLSNIIKYMNNLLKNTKVQIIIATHSPFVVANIAKQNSIFLAKKRNKVIVCDIEEIPETFGSSISNIVSDNFAADQIINKSFTINTVLSTITEIIKDNQMDNESKIKILKSYNAIIGDKLIVGQLSRVIERLSRND